ncbi:MAG TPA: hypothetical protein VIJ35_01035 [Bradyrhizobium sp.]
MRQHRRLEDDDDAFQNGVIKDGARVRVPMFAMDAVQKSVALNGLRVTDGSDDSAGLHRPGPRYIADAAMRDAKQAAYDAYLHDVTNAWRGSQPREIEVKLLTGDAREDADAAYLEYVTNAWRGPRDSGKW